MINENKQMPNNPKSVSSQALLISNAKLPDIKNSFFHLLQSKSLFICLFVYLFICLFFLSASTKVLASATPSAQESPKATASSTLLDKINEIKTKAASKAADFISEVAKKLQNKAYFGVITSIDSEKITIKLGEAEKEILTDEYTHLIFPGKASKKSPVIDDLKTGDFVSALGDVDDKNVLKAKKLVKSSPIATDSSKLVWGTVQKVQGGTITLKLVDTTDQIITASGQTTIFLGPEEASLLDIKSGRTVVIRGQESKDRIISAVYIYVIPQSVNAKPEKKPDPSVIASPSASPRRK